ncbi:hypothetical protein J1605_015803 [Eschrichtius robustus]|uniref:Basic proline-rich protein-like n=1 Tax=Eschrichtius robustus TaxID=9764 RepID=A0AB34G9V4_ESCRO|nr:hypothetical protein J1605_015803 [Eschrichtius robustus]
MKKAEEWQEGLLRQVQVQQGPPVAFGSHTPGHTIDSQGNQGRRLRSRTRLQLALGSRSASSLVTVPLGARLGGLTCCPCGRPATAGWRLAGPTARAERLGAPLASAARRAPPREWAAAARLLVCRTPAPRPARPGEKALIGKIAQERGWRGAAGARRELRRPGRRRRPPTPDELTVQRGEGRAQGVCRACVSAQQQRPPPPGSRPQSRPPAFAPSLGCPDKFDSALGGLGSLPWFAPFGPLAPLSWGPALHYHGPEAHRDPGAQSPPSLTGTPEQVPLSLEAPTPAPPPLPGRWSHWAQGPFRQERKPLPPQVDSGWAAGSWSAGGLLAQCPISSRVERGGREAVGTGGAQVSPFRSGPFPLLLLPGRPAGARPGNPKRRSSAEGPAPSRTHSPALSHGPTGPRLFGSSAPYIPLSPLANPGPTALRRGLPASWLRPAQRARPAGTAVGRERDAGVTRA